MAPSQSKALRTLISLFVWLFPAIYACGVGGPTTDSAKPGKTDKGGSTSTEDEKDPSGGKSGSGGKSSSGGETQTPFGGDTGSGGESSFGGMGGSASGGTGTDCGDLAECSGKCVDLETDSAHCGECKVVCSGGDNAEPLCDSGDCTLDCKEDYGDCNSDPTDGCENLLIEDPENCGECGKKCGEAPGATIKCTNSACLMTCDDGLDDCDEKPENGCETNVKSSASHCGSCGEKCHGICKDGTCVELRRVFVTSTLYNGNLGGLDGADAKCQARADAAGLTGTFRAWLSDSTGSPSTRFEKSLVAYALVDNTKIANDWEDLVDGTILHKIHLDEFGQPAPTGNTSCAGGGQRTAWSATSSSGKLLQSDRSCEDWSSSDAKGAAWGLIDAVVNPPTQEYWTSSCSSAGTACYLSSPLYCFEQ